VSDFLAAEKGATSTRHQGLEDAEDAGCSQRLSFVGEIPVDQGDLIRHFVILLRHPIRLSCKIGKPTLLALWID
jgi:hypothetical protein